METQTEANLSEQPAGLTRTDMLDMFKEMKAQISDTMEQAVNEVREMKDSTDSDNGYKRRKVDKPIAFKYKGNEMQHKFNLEILEFLDDALNFLNRGKAIDCTEILQDMLRSVKRRNKLIRMADRSEAGWDVVLEYEDDELASDSEDDRKMRRAESTALRKRKTKLQKRMPRMIPGQNHTWTPNSATASNHQQQPFRPGPRAAGPFDLCFACGKFGHWRNECKAGQQGIHAEGGQASNPRPIPNHIGNGGR